MPYEEVESKKQCIRWGYVAAIILLCILLLSSIPFIIKNDAPKEFLYIMLAIIILILLSALLIMEFYRKKTAERRGMNNGHLVVQKIHTKTINSERVEVSTFEVGTTRSSWLHWTPHSSYEPTPLRTNNLQ